MGGREAEEEKMDSDREVNSRVRNHILDSEQQRQGPTGLPPPAGMASTPGAHIHRWNTPRTTTSFLDPT